MQEVTETLTLIVHNMSTKDDIVELRQELRSEIQQVKHELMDHVSRETSKVRGDLVSLLRKEDEKIDGVIDVIADKRLVTPQAAENLRAIGPFKRFEKAA